MGLDYGQVEGPSVRKVHHYDRGCPGGLRHRDKTNRPQVPFLFKDYFFVFGDRASTDEGEEILNNSA